MNEDLKKIKEKAESLFNQGEYENALKNYFFLLEQKEYFENKVFGKLQNQIGLCYYFLNNYEKAVEYFKQYLNCIEDESKPDENDRAIALLNIGNSLSNVLKKEEAIKYLLASLKIYITLFGEETQQVISLNNSIANSYFFLKLYSEAEPFFLNAKKLSEKVLGNESEKTNLYRYNLALNYYNCEKVENAYVEFVLVAEYFKKENSLLNLIDILDKLTNACQSIPVNAEHEIYFQRLYSNVVEIYGLENINSGTSAKKLAKYYNRLGDYPSAAKYFEVALSSYNKLKGEFDSNSLEIATSLAAVYYHNQQYLKSKDILEFILLIQKRKYNENEEPLLITIVNLAYSNFYTENYDEAERLFKDAVNKSSKINGYDSVHTTKFKAKLAKIFYIKGQFEEAVEILKEVIQIEIKRLKFRENILADLYFELAQSLKCMSRQALESELYYTKAIELYEKKLKDHHPKIIISKLDLASVYSDILNNQEKALTILSKTAEILDKNSLHYSSYMQDTLLAIGNIFKSEENYNMANRYYKKSLDFINKSDKNFSKAKINLLEQFSQTEFLRGEKLTSKKYLSECYHLSKIVNGLKSKKTNSFKKLILENFGNEILIEITGNSYGTDGLKEYNKFVENELITNSGKRNVRVFISSTFRDMMSERDFLMKTIFPEIKQTCKQYGIDFTEVDLRWGITKEDVEQGNVIEICLNEIDKSRPYFIGILGERYGWIPDNKMLSNIRKTLNNFQWLEEDFNNELSITEMEIQYGVLRNSKMEGNAFFYLRDKYLTPENEDFFENTNSKEYNKLKSLKTSLYKQSEYPVQVFNSLKELGDLISNDLQKAIIRDSKLYNKISKLEKRRVSQLNYINRQCDFYIPIDNSLNQLDKFITSDRNKAIIFSSPGKGKSALLSNWLKEKFQRKENNVILFHFADADPYSMDFNIILSHLSDELQNIFNIENQFSLDSLNPAEDFGTNLRDKNINSEVVILIDGIEKIKQNNFFKKLFWLPLEIPKNISLIFSTNDNELLDILLERGFERILLDEMNIKQKEQFIIQFLNKFGKKLPNDLIRKILDDNVSESPNSLQIVLNELRLFGQHEELEIELNKYLSAETITELFIIILERLERDFDSNFPGLTGKALSLLAISKGGLLESEITELTNSAQLFWSPILNSLENYFTRFEGLIRIGDDYLLVAVKKKYFVDIAYEREIKELFTKYLLSSGTTKRKVEELGDLLCDLKDYENLAHFITDFKVFNLLMKQAKYDEFLKYKNLIHEQYNIVELFKKNFQKESKTNENLIELAEPLLKISQMLRLDSKTDNAMFFVKLSLEIRKRVLGDNNPQTAEAMIEIAGVMANLNKKLEAIEIYKEAISIIENNPYKSGIKIGLAYTSVGKLLLEYGKINDAWQYASKSKQYFEKEMGDNNTLVAEAYNLFGMIELKRGNIESAEDYCNEAMSLIENSVGKDSFIAQALVVNLMEIYKKKGDKRKILELSIKAESVMSTKLGKNNYMVKIIKFTIANTYYQLEEFDKAEKSALQLFNLANDTNQLGESWAKNCMMLLAIIYYKTGKEEKKKEMDSLLEGLSNSPKYIK